MCKRAFRVRSIDRPYPRIGPIETITSFACADGNPLEIGSTLSLPTVINIKFPLQPHQEYYITRYKAHGFSGDYTSNSHDFRSIGPHPLTLTM